MPGIAGIVSADRARSASAIASMVQAMMHEPFYTCGTYVNGAIGIAVGWVERRGSFAARTPIWNDARDRCLIFHGEHFDHGAAQRGAGARARRLLDAFAGDAARGVVSLNGWFSGVLVDLRRCEALLFNDRYGMQRLYCHERDGTLHFASEAKALLAVLPELRRPDMRGWAEVCSFGCVLDDRTLFAGVSLVPPGSLWTFARGKVAHERRYFTPDAWEGQPPLPAGEFQERLEDTFRSALPAYLTAEEPIAMSLTGGLDTRMILAQGDVRPGQLPCYSFGGMYNECYDVGISREIARLCRQEHRVLRVGREFLAEFPSLAEKTVHVSDGGMDVTGAADLYVNRLARDIAPVRLTGNYGSEILRGARHLKVTPPPDRVFEPWFERQIDLAGGALAAMWEGRRIAVAAFRQAPWHHYNRLCVEQSQLTVRSPYLDNALVALMFRAPADAVDSAEPSLGLIRNGNHGLAAILTDRGLSANRSSVRSRTTRAFRDFLFKADYAFNYGMPKWLASVDRFAIAPFRIERLFLGRHKFHHFRVWFRDELAAYVKDVLLDPRSVRRPYLRKGALEHLVHAHTSGTANHTTEITKLLTFELLQRKLIEQ